jgi:hypothetical protein
MFFPRGELKNWFNFTFCEDIASQETVVSLVLYFLNFVLFSLDARVLDCIILIYFFLFF